MITSADDFCLHQTPAYIAVPGSRWNTVPWISWAPAGDRIAYFVRAEKNRTLIVQNVLSREIEQRVDKNTVDELLTVAGAHNLAAQLGKHKATRISTEELATTDPDWLMLSSWKHAGSVPFPEQARTLRAYREGRILRIPSKLLLSTTHRLALAADTLQKALHRDCAK